MFHRTVLASAIGLVVSPLLAEEADSTNELQTIQVIGQAASVDKALSRQRAADNIESTTQADDIGDFPDSNVSESLQRLPGVSIERDQGEGRFVRVRGVAPDLNARDSVHLDGEDSLAALVACAVILEPIGIAA